MKRLIVGLATLVVLCAPRQVALAACAGDCGGDRTVTVNELILGVNIALGNTPAAQCAAIDTSGDGQVAINELIAAVASALSGCPFTGAFTGMADIGSDQTAVIHLEVAPNGQATGTMSVTSRAAARLGLGGAAGIPTFGLSGTVNLDTGAYTVTGSFTNEDGELVPVHASGTLPDRTGASGTLRLEIGPDIFDRGVITTGTGVAPTPTGPPATSTPTATGTPDTGPTPEPGCEGGSFHSVFSNVQGTNANQPLEGAFDLTKVAGTLVSLSEGAPPFSFGGGALACGYTLGQVIRRFQWGVFGDFTTGLVIGRAYPLGLRLGDSYFDYLETPTTNPLGTIGWSADGGSFIIDSISDTTVTFRVIDAHMVPEPSFSFGQPATGTFTLTVTGSLDRTAQP